MKNVFDAPEAGRLDKFLAGAVAGVSRGWIQRQIALGFAHVEREEKRIPATESDFQLQAGDRVTLKVPEEADRTPGLYSKKHPPKGLTILFEDSDLVVVDKPAGLVVHPAAGHRGDTLSDWLRAAWGASRCAKFQDPERPGIVHRLDKGTSGVLAIAKNPKAHASLMTQFEKRKVQKTYVAIAHGAFQESKGVIEGPIGRDPDHPTRMAICADGRESETAFRVRGRRGEFSRMELYPKTGRTHQIRVHLAAYGHPVAGDRLYGSPLEHVRPMLHAWRLEVIHPKTGRPRKFEAKIPKDFEEFWKMCGK